LMEAVPGLMVKCGAEGVDAFALADGRAGAVKVDDGAMRARTPATVALLRALGVPDGDGEVDEAALEELSTIPVRGGGAVVGAIRPTPGLFTGN
ncbi:MAG TPA: asparaginase, partial [Spirillospora sp.]